MKNSRLARTIFAVIFLILFGIYTIKTDTIRYHSRDVESWGEAVALHPEDNVQVRKLEDEAAAEAPAAETEEPAAETPEPTPEEPDLPQVDLASWELMLVNKDNPLSADYAPPEVVTLSDSQCPVDSRIADALTRFAEDAKAQGLSVYLSSGYRSYSEQSANLQRKLDEGYPYETAITIVAEPGTSEHQTGLCCDITDVYYALKDPDVLELTDTYKWMSQHCQEYGFIVRYPEGKSELTGGIIYEPWHFRYVGVEAATYIMEHGLCLEEFVELYK